MMAAVAAREVSGILAYAPDRLYRRLPDLSHFIDVVRGSGCLVATVAAGDLDLSTAAGRQTAGLLGVVAVGESERMGERIRRKLAENAATGKHHGGSRPYGWLPDRTSICEPEAVVVREVATRILAGESMRSIFRNLNARGVPNSQGNPWTHSTLRGVMMRARNAGLRIHHGEVVGEGQWEPIMPVETWRAVERVLSAPSRVTTPGRAGRVHLLSSIARCDVCGGPLHVGTSGAGMKDGRRVSYEVYRCKRGSHVTRHKVYLEIAITEMLLDHIAREGEALLRPNDDGEWRRAEAQADTLRQRLDDAAASFAQGEIDARQLATITALLRPQLAEWERQATPPRDRTSVLGPLVEGAPVPVEELERRWEGLTTEQKRAVLDMVVTIRIGRGKIGAGFSRVGLYVAGRH
jgi:hypothetical protein